MIIAKLQGGLGNQMFQYACARALALKYKTQLKFDTSYYHYVRGRRLQLDQFGIKIPSATFKDLGVLSPVVIPSFTEFWEKVYVEFQLSLAFQVIREQKYYEFHQIELDKKKHAYLDGYWQNPKYFLKYADQLKTDFQIPKLSNKTLVTLRKQMQRVNSVSVHVRRGDYLKLDHFGACSLEYYIKCAQRMRRLVKNPTYYVFSDDITWCKSQFGFMKNATYIEKLHQNEIDELALMSSCKHHIIANSTYSWWGAWLSKEKNGITIAPTPWVSNPALDSSGVYEKKWIRISK